MTRKFIICLIISPLLVMAQAPKFSNDFLNIGVGARGMALAGAVSASSNSVQTAYWNPAGLIHNSAKFQVSAQHAEWFSGIGNYDYIGFGKFLDGESKSFGSISLIRMAIDQIPNTLRLRGPDGSIDYSRIEEFSVADYALFLSYGRKFSNPAWSGGVNTKIIHRGFGSFANSWGFGFDLAVKYQKNNWSFALMGRDITTSFNAYRFSFTTEEKAVLLQTNNSIPSNSVEYTLPKIISGTTYTFNIKSKLQLAASLDLEWSTNGTKSSLLSSNHFNIDPRAGLELAYNKRIFVRLGASNFQNVQSTDSSNSKDFSFYPAAGLGVKLGRVTIDYAMTNIGNSGIGLYSNFFSLNLDL